MTVPSTATFILDYDGLNDLAWARVERVLQRDQNAKDFKRGLRAYGLLCQDIDLRGANLWAIDEQTLTLAVGDKDYALATDTIDILDMRLVDPSFGSDTVRLTRMSRDEYRDVSDRDTTGRPLQFWLQRLRDQTVLHVWPLPDKDGYLLKYDRTLRLRDVDSILDDVDLPARWMPALVSGLAYHMARITAGFPSAELPVLKEEWLEDYGEASADDSEDVPLRLDYDLTGYSRV